MRVLPRPMRDSWQVCSSKVAIPYIGEYGQVDLAECDENENGNGNGNENGNENENENENDLARDQSIIHASAGDNYISIYKGLLY